jgi:hypothetical protein
MRYGASSAFAGSKSVMTLKRRVTLDGQHPRTRFALSIISWTESGPRGCVLGKEDSCEGVLEGAAAAMLSDDSDIVNFDALDLSARGKNF